MRKIPFAGIDLTSQRVRGLRGTSELPGRPVHVLILLAVNIDMNIISGMVSHGINTVLVLLAINIDVNSGMVAHDINITFALQLLAVNIDVDITSGMVTYDINITINSSMVTHDITVINTIPSG